MLRLALVLASVAQGAATHAPAGHVESRTLESEALADNSLGLPGVGQFEVYLPPSYAHAPERRYPVLYLLHGIGGTSRDWTEQTPTIPSMLDELAMRGAIGEFLVVMPTAMTTFGGSFYVNSSVNGRWDDYIVGDLIPFIDGKYRTLAERAQRAIAGHSMGGYGALRLTLEHPELFSATVALSPACLDVVGDLGPANPNWARMGEFKDHGALVAELRDGNMYPMSLVALAAAFSPDARATPFPVRLPYGERGGAVEPAPETLTLWQRATIVGAARARPDAYRDLRLLFIDYGYREEFPHIPAGVEALHDLLTSQRIPHVIDAYDGTHNDVLRQRLRERVLPLLATVLAPAGG